MCAFRVALALLYTIHIMVPWGSKRVQERGAAQTFSLCQLAKALAYVVLCVLWRCKPPGVAIEVAIRKQKTARGMQCVLLKTASLFTVRFAR